jgi:hypothetical protein
MQPTPKVSRDDVERIVRRDFPSSEFVNVVAVLDKYGSGKWHRERERVQVAVLKLAKGKMDALRREIENAKCDYREVIAPAEYPKYSKRFANRKLPSEEQERIFAQDWKQYEDWFNAK